ncbi:Protein of unknown function [Gracilibacillus orientalis]|uniref:DUF2624 domain-containing protein n=1 Tax=Gracilibacillus orientalis TaxID=334253 RepID=A0A1I4KSL5_9BACI|nr:DUF2624 family protein [Gracilibacillus orientalis]SFL81730.1 Protein of unknown function [Gracilibacillus orientalis]
MNGLTKRIMVSKLKKISTKEITEYANKYRISITEEQAKLISGHLKRSSYDPLIAEDRAQMLKKLAQITDIKTAKACQQLFHKLIKEYGVEDYFK